MLCLRFGKVGLEEGFVCCKPLYLEWCDFWNNVLGEGIAQGGEVLGIQGNAIKRELLSNCLNYVRVCDSDWGDSIKDWGDAESQVGSSILGYSVV